jgi:hypothetical protein
VVRLVAGRNQEGYDHALTRTWEDLGRAEEDAPVKSALSQARQRVSFRFFRDLFEEQMLSFEAERPTYKGLHIYAVDGDQLSLPASADILAHGYRGYPSPRKRETYFPRMYVTHAADMISGVSKAFRYSTTNEEHVHACRMARGFETNSLSLYDRLHLSGHLIRAHHRAGNYFLVRCRRGATFREVKQMFRSLKRNLTFTVDGVPVRLVKIRNPKAHRDDVYATNLPVGFLSNREVRQMYSYRWGIETTFRDFTATLKAEQWHTQTLNGILQELFAALWLLNFAKITLCQRSGPTRDFMKFAYRKSNFKLVLDFLCDHFPEALRSFSQSFAARLDALIRRSREKRRHGSRSYPRQLRAPASRYPLCSLVERRA